MKYGECQLFVKAVVADRFQMLRNKISRRLFHPIAQSHMTFLNLFAKCSCSSAVEHCVSNAKGRKSKTTSSERKNFL